MERESVCKLACAVLCCAVLCAGSAVLLCVTPSPDPRIPLPVNTDTRRTSHTSLTVTWRPVERPTQPISFTSFPSSPTHPLSRKLWALTLSRQRRESSVRLLHHRMQRRWRHWALR